MNDIRFKNLEDLYRRLLPALKSKVKELHRKGLKYIQEETLWNYLKEYKWINSLDLDLASMVNDIFEVKTEELEAYAREIYWRKINNE